MHRIVATFIAAVVATGALPAASFAQDTPSASQEALARDFRRQGIEAAREDDWQAARRHFARSYELDPRLLSLYNLAAAELKVEAYVEADQHFRTFLRLAEGDELAQFIEEATASRQEIATKLGHLRIVAENIARGDRVELDGNEFPQAGLDAELPVNPGLHTVRVMRDGEQIAEASHTIEEGGSASVRLEVPAASDRNAPPSPREVAVAADIQDDAAIPESHTGRNVAIGITAVVVVAAVAVGVFFAVRPDPDPFQGSTAVIDFR